MTNDNKIKGRAVHGDIVWGEQNTTPQIGVKEFLVRLDNILNHPLVEKVRWRQYTPYFMDGDPCVFGVEDLQVRIVGTDEDSDEGDWEDGYVDSWDLSYRDDDVDYSDLKAVIKANWKPGAFEKVCLTNFGDHAVVTATKDGFNVEYYEHD